MTTIINPVNPIARTTTVKPELTLGRATAAATVLRRARLGNSTEDISYSPTGAFGGQFLILDGYDVLLLAPAGSGEHGVQKLFDVRGLAVTGAPRGLAFLESERLFVVNDLRRRSTLLLADLRGRPAGERTIQYPKGFAPDQVEGLDAIDAPSLTQGTGELLVLSALSFTPGLRSHLELLIRSGNSYLTSRDVVPADPVGSSFVAGAAFRQRLAALRE